MQRRNDRDPAVLHCVLCDGFTEHTFAEERSTENTCDPHEVAIVYACDRCGNDRIWGLGRGRDYRRLQQLASKRRMGVPPRQQSTVAS